MEKTSIESYFDECAVALDNTLYVEDTLIYDLIKRAIDIVLSTIGIVIGIPIIFIFSILIVLETPGSPIYSQERVGKNGKKFTIYKLRSMYSDAEKNGAKWASKNDPRVTKVGSFIRKTRIDELPQLFNILKGDMSIVGPRPERPVFTYQFNEEIPGFINRLAVKPGLTGWAQVNGGYEMTPKEKLQADMYYIRNRSLMLDIYIILKTVKIIFTGEGAR
ncbi:exopolysaccharide biosynthesis polyprenyl glycosylphosphotransferase [Alkalithermobacter thermoalcaliphilus JW-YL-7 = DSM 7308]|uniref:Exopolysaccharide biosynthesis polyprenyl glycosylphosphotransferase n=1 Tax=Alkalithermobacter thermoalcaliphilus JW-YL-7 = DSM 7308 TaxID=1121328 RepID=A0A150FU63_CLOPD|nr:exopolysaccharide biosynthesis polyprenyl glycosylphosphotransferase [[Clostridium] paradoxum JW-YL-7 = DSM 7308]SHK69962.1 exopolysaccharide biosynthesis polyprenyl glycosylphosphotransferase [[Clostridium] paradoxum JW-YL-7 = DSM 7308]